ncbi:hypothetical protein CYMTET_6989 [Cymbomonas tetramitiformis]|uniref:Rab-GAP TBC domain-containing protein n=1 Tax=Cymbomonas tetramitiformis TaxID=36881 RepID=A0AAE0LHB8_9CHLO|nr:hypothetical protein CYMTET_6989 [Cymbomonas tetramitiformis]
MRKRARAQEYVARNVAQAFLAAIFLMHLKDDDKREENAFILLNYIMFECGLRGMYMSGMEQFKVWLEYLQRMQDIHVPELVHHLQKLGISPIMYAAPWFLTLFASSMPLELVWAVVDTVLTERSASIIFQTSITLLKECAGSLLQCGSIESVMEVLNTELPDYLAQADSINIVTKALTIELPLEVSAPLINRLRDRAAPGGCQHTRAMCRVFLGQEEKGDHTEQSVVPPSGSTQAHVAANKASPGTLAVTACARGRGRKCSVRAARCLQAWARLRQVEMKDVPARCLQAWARLRQVEMKDVPARCLQAWARLRQVEMKDVPARCLQAWARLRQVEMKDVPARCLQAWARLRQVEMKDVPARCLQAWARLRQEQRVLKPDCAKVVIPRSLVRNLATLSAPLTRVPQDARRAKWYDPNRNTPYSKHLRRRRAGEQSCSMHMRTDPRAGAVKAQGAIEALKPWYSQARAARGERLTWRPVHVEPALCGAPGALGVSSTPICTFGEDLPGTGLATNSRVLSRWDSGEGIKQE